eukprot:10399986-Ditylum_brightwellii.AAC.1
MEQVKATKHSAWCYHAIIRNSKNKTCAKASKTSAGPAKLDKIISFTFAFLLAFSYLHHKNYTISIGVAGSETAILCPCNGRE